MGGSVYFSWECARVTAQVGKQITGKATKFEDARDAGYQVFNYHFSINFNLMYSLQPQPQAEP